MNTTVEAKTNSLVGDKLVSHIELITSEGVSSVDVFNSSSCVLLNETGSSISVGFSIPADESASAFVYSLMLGANIETIKTHRSNKDGVVVLTIKHDIQMVKDWSINDNTIQVKFLTESSVVINGDISIEEEESGSSN